MERERSAESGAECKHFQSWLLLLKAVTKIKVAVKPIQLVDGHVGLTVVLFVAVETTQVFSEKLPVLSGENEDVFIPPVARRSLQVVPGQRNNER